MDDENIDINPDFLQDPTCFSTLPHVVDVLEQQSQNSQEPLHLDSTECDARIQLENKLRQVENRLESLVHTHHSAFGNSVKSFSEIFQEFTEAQSRISYLKKHVSACKLTLRHRKQQIKELSQKKLESQEMINLLEQLERVRDAPLQFRKLLDQNLYVECVDEYHAVSAILYGEVFCSVASLEDTRLELAAWKQDIVVAIQSQLGKLLFLDSLTFTSIPDGPRFGRSDDSKSMLYKPNVPSTSKPWQTCNNDCAIRMSNGLLNGLSLIPRPCDHLAMQNVLLAVQSLGRLEAVVQVVRRDLRMSVQTIFEENCSNSQIDIYPAQGPKGTPHDSGVFEMLHIYQPVKLAFERILRDLLFLLCNHRALIEAVPLQEVGYSIEEPWNAIQVHLKTFLDNHLHIATLPDLQPASPKSRATSRSNSRRGSHANSVHAPGSTSAHLGLRYLSVDALATEESNRGNATINNAMNELKKTHSPGSRRQSRDLIQEDHNVFPTLCKPDPYLVLVFVRPLTQFLAQAGQALSGNTSPNNSVSKDPRKGGPLREYLQEACANVFKIEVEGQVAAFMKHTLTSENLSEYVASNEELNRMSNNHTLGNLENFDVNGTETTFDSMGEIDTVHELFPTLLTLRVRRVVNDLNCYSAILSTIQFGFHDLIAQVLNQTLRFVVEQQESQLSHQSVNSLLTQSQGYLEFVKENDMSLREAITMSSLYKQSDRSQFNEQSRGNSSTRDTSILHEDVESHLMFIHEENVIFVKYVEQLIDHQTNGEAVHGISFLSTDGQSILGILSTSMLWLVRELTEGSVPLSKSNNNTKLLKGLEQVHLKGLIALHAEARLLVQVFLITKQIPLPGDNNHASGRRASLDGSDETLMKARSRASSIEAQSELSHEQLVARLRSRLTDLGRHLSSLARVVLSSKIPQSFLDYVFHSTGAAVAGLLVQALGKVQGTVDLQTLKALVQTGFILEHTLQSIIKDPKLVATLAQSFEAVALYVGALTGNTAWDNSETVSQLATISRCLPGVDSKWLKSTLRNAKDRARKKHE